MFLNVFIAAVFTGASRYKQPKCLLTDVFRGLLFVNKENRVVVAKVERGGEDQRVVYLVHNFGFARANLLEVED